MNETACIPIQILILNELRRTNVIDDTLFAMAKDKVEASAKSMPYSPNPTAPVRITA